MGERALVGRLASALVDGDAVDWDSATAEARSDRERALLGHLRDIAWLERQSRPDLRVAVRPSRPAARPWAVLLAALAFAHIATALLGFLAGAAAEPPRLLHAQLAILSSFTAASLVLAFGGRGDVRARRLALFYLLVAAALARPMLRLVTPFVPSWLTWLWNGLYPESFLALAAWQFAREFPQAVRFTPFDRVASRLTALAAALGIGLAVLSAVPPALVDATREGILGWLWPLRRSHDATRFWDVTYAFMLSALAATVVRSRSASRDERRRVLWFALVLGIGFGPLFAVGALDAFTGSTSWSTRMPVLGRLADACVLAGLFLTPLVTSYIVLVHRVLSVRIVVRRALQYALARYTLGMLVLAPVVVVVVQAHRFRERPLQELWREPGTAWAIWALAAGAALVAGRGALLRAIDRLFLGREVDHAQRMAQAADAIGRARTPREIGAEVARAIDATLGASSIAAFACDPDGRWQTLHGTVPAPPADSAVFALLADSADPLRVSSDGGLLALLPAADQCWIACGGFETIARIPAVERGVAGLVAVGRRANGFAHSRADLSFLAAAAGTAGVALDARRRATDADGGMRDSTREELGFECDRCGAVADGPGRCPCGQPRTLSRLPLALQDKFRIERRLGQGGMGVVYLARDTRLDRQVALKTLPDLSEGAVARMLAEARAMAAVEHPSLALIFGMEVWRHTPILVVEYLAGGTLASRLASGPLAADDAIAVGIALADALAELHGRGLLHRDIKPSNIGFGRAGTPKLLDFGLARLLARAHQDEGGQVPGFDPMDAATHATALAGTPLYLSPEVLGGQAPDTRTDLWALSVVLFEAIAGAHPFLAPTVGGVLRRIRDARELDLRRWRADAPTGLAVFCRRALHPDVTRRPDSAASMAAELRRLRTAHR